ncbi:EAL and GGDEF domain-containing protein [Noviherbaspirillum sp. ST9]|uniref:sensor domain-containing protein n=1 Tax=Noviherbaspirillum sp. ST9 TaxID=3401606 RepID=UPI003B5878B1
MPFGEESIRQLAKADIVPMCCWKLDGGIVEANDLFCRMTGYTPQELQAGTVRLADLSAPGALSVDFRVRESLRASGSILPFETAITAKDGRRVRVLAGCALFADSQERGVAFFFALDERRQLDAVPENEEIYRQAAEAAADAILILDRDGGITYANASAGHAFGLQTDTLTGRNLVRMIPAHCAGDASALREALGSGKASENWQRIEATVRHEEGHTMLLEISLGKFRHSGKTLFAAVVFDITERKKTQLICTGQNQLLEMIALGAPMDEVLEKLVLLIESQTPGMLGSILLLDKDGVHVRHGAAPNLPIEYIRAVDGQPIGPTAGSCGTAMYTGKPVIVSDILVDRLWTDYREVATRHKLRACWSTPIRVSGGQVRGSFAMYYVEPRSPKPEDLRVAELASHIAGIAIERRDAEERISHLARHDALTGLPNRTMLHGALVQAIAHAGRRKSIVGLLFIDLDNFKRINDSLGHHVGDLLLQGAARRLQACLRKDDMLVRLGGDEFVILLASLRHSQESALVAAKALSVLDAPFELEGHVLHTGGSIGISLYPDDGKDAETLMRAADTAMYHAKAKGRGNYQFFTEELNASIQYRLATENQLRSALSRGELSLHFQPQVDMESSRIFCAEALVRWHHAERGMVPPEQFISIAEESGLIVQIGEWVLREACAHLAQWHARGRMDMCVSVNLSARQIFQQDFPELVERVLKEFEVPARALDLEITETMLMQPSDDNMGTLTRLSEMGVQLSVDDFGIGYSSLSYLKRFPIHALKIDRSFVSGIGRDQNDMAITSAIMGMAQGLHLKVVAEGVETTEQAHYLRSIGCTSAQGFLFGKPVAADAFSRLL